MKASVIPDNTGSSHMLGLTAETDEEKEILLQLAYMNVCLESADDLNLDDPNLSVSVNVTTGGWKKATLKLKPGPALLVT